MKKYFWLLACLIASSVFVSCGDDDDPVIPYIPSSSSTTMYFLNEGAWNLPNSASLCAYDTEAGTVSVMDAATAVIGDTPNDIIAADGKLYVACWGSQGLLVADANYAAAEPKFVSLDEQPRYMAYKSPYLYISCYGGRVLRYNTKSGDISTLQTTGGNLEGIAIVGNQLFVCNSHNVDASYNYTYNSDLVVIDLSTFTQTGTISTVTNPNYIFALNGKLYVLGFGNYDDAGYMVAEVDPAAATSTDIVAGSKFCTWNGNVLIVNSETDWSTYAVTTSAKLYNPAGGSTTSVTLPQAVVGSTVYMAAEDPDSHDLYLSTTDYSTTGKIYRIGSDLSTLDVFSSEGINPSRAAFVTK